MARYDSEPAARAAALGALLARYYPNAPHHLIGDVVFRMRRHARHAVRWETKRCNVLMNEVQQEAGKARLRQHEREVNTRLARARLYAGATTEGCGDTPHAKPATVSYGGDARGACAFLHIPGSPGDGFETEAYAIW